MTPLRQRLIEDLRLRGFAKNTQKAYLAAVVKLSEYYRKSPDQVTDEELHEYFLYLTGTKKVSVSALRIALAGIRFFFDHTLRRAMPTLALTRPPNEKKLPVVLSLNEINRILSCVRVRRFRVLLSTVFVCGLRLREGPSLRVSEMDGARGLVHVQLGKGQRDGGMSLATLLAKSQRGSSYAGHRQSSRRNRMLLPSDRLQAIPEETQRIARAAFLKGSLAMGLRDELGTIYLDDQASDPIGYAIAVAIFAERHRARPRENGIG